jgi:uncharacterized protein YdeI (YjbR/CyaY-like superfamily)
MDLGELFETSSRKAWRAWLARNHKRKREIWLVYPRTHTGKKRVSYNDAVEEALCYGWIDSTAKGVDKDRYAQRFSPRRRTSGLSEMNRQRVKKLIKTKKMTKAGMDAIAHVYPAKQNKKLTVPKYIEKALKAEKAWTNFQKFPLGYKQIRVAFIEGQKRHGAAQHKRALNNFVRNTAKNKRIGFVKEMR